jgi:hypothetical protein
MTVDRRKTVYAAVVVFVTLVAVGVGNVLYTNHVDGRRAESARAGAEAQRRAGEQVKAAVCSMILANVQVYRETPPPAAAGKNLAESWELLSTQFGC